MPEDEKGGDQGGDEGGGDQSDDTGPLELGYEIRHRDPSGFERRAAGDEAPEDSGDSKVVPDPDDPGPFDLVDLTEEERRREGL
jgi:hypothetical protein